MFWAHNSTGALSHGCGTRNECIVMCGQSVCVFTCNVRRCFVHTPVDYLGIESCRQAKNNYLNKLKRNLSESFLVVEPQASIC